MNTHQTAIQSILGSLFDLLTEPGVVEISVNPSLDVFVERFGVGSQSWGRVDEAVVERFIRYCASHCDTVINKQDPILSGRVPGFAHRIEALIPPIVEAPSFSIRRHMNQVIKLEEYVANTDALEIIKDGIFRKQNILIAGSTGSGKTTLTNACIDHLGTVAPDTRLLILEDTPEIQCNLVNRVPLRTSDDVDMDKLLVSSLRYAPDRIMVGEVRTGEVLMTLMKAWNTGHPGGITTLHSNSGEEVLPRLQQLCHEVSISDQTDFILSTMDMIVYVTRTTSAPFVAEIISINRTDKVPKMETLYAHL